MRNVFIVPGKLACKGFALMFLSFLTIFVFVYSLLVFLYRMVAAVFSVIGACLIAVECYQYGFNGERFMIILALIIAVVLRYLLPMLTLVMEGWKQKLTRYIYAPLFTRPPVRYTI